MGGIFTELLDAFFAPPDMAAAEREIEEYHRQLIERLDKPERKLVLHIMDDKDAIADVLTRASFKAGFSLAYRIMNQIQTDAHTGSASPCGRQLFSEEERK